MRTTETIVSVIRERGRQQLPLERVYRLLFNQELYLNAYAKLYPNAGAMTKGSTTETVDGMSLAKIDRLISDLRHETYKWTPARRTYIPKPNGKKRPLGIPTWRDKLLQEVIRTILEAYFEPQFSVHSHGFRPNKGCHTALNAVESEWTGTKWFIEGDIAQYFDTIKHDTLIAILAKHIHDGRFLRLIRELLSAGYMEEWVWHRTYSGTPQGGVISPLLANIYLNEFDQWVQATLISAHTCGARRRSHPEYTRITSRLYKMRKRGAIDGATALIKRRRQLPSVDPNDPAFRRLYYVRYADDFLLGLIGTKQEAEAIKRRIKEWLGENLKLNLSEEKTLITHATTESARFLGYTIAAQNVPDKIDAYGRRSLNGKICLRVPANVVEKHCRKYTRHGKVIHRAELRADSDYDIITRYQQEYRGIVQYYQLATNVGWFHKLHWIMGTSLLKTLAARHRTTIHNVVKKYKRTTTTPDGKVLACLEVTVQREGKKPLIARFGGISLTRQPQATVNDYLAGHRIGRSELIQRLLADECELCGSREHIQVHHVHKLADVNKPGRKPKPRWMHLMAARRRKTLVVCHACHVAIHNGKPTRQANTDTLLESRMP